MPELGTQTQLVSRDKRKSEEISDCKEVTDRYNGGTLMLFQVNGKWLTEAEINKSYLVVGIDEMPVDAW